MNLSALYASNPITDKHNGEYAMNTLNILQRRVERTTEELVSEYEENLDFADVNIEGVSFSRSRILRTLDPIAYREGFNNFIDYLIEDNEIVEYEDNLGTYYNNDSLGY